MRRLDKAAAIRSRDPACVPVLMSMFVGSASAHVKWFCAYDVAGQPDGPGKRPLPRLRDAHRPFDPGADDRRACSKARRSGSAMLHALDRATRLGARQYRNDFSRRLRVLLHRYLGRRRHPADAGAQDGFDTGLAPFNSASRPGMVSRQDDAVVGARNLRLVRRRRLELWSVPPRRLSDLSRRRGLSRFDRRPDQFFRRAPDRRIALGCRHHLDVGLDREMGLSGMVISAFHHCIRR